MKNSNKYLSVYSLALTAAFFTLVVFTLTRGDRGRMEVLDVQRINIREPDGTLKYVLSNKAMLPGLIIRGKEYAHDRETAAMLFYNDEGTENGGLLFSGSDGDSVGHLSFDAYEQDQVIALSTTSFGEETRSGLTVSDRPVGRSIEKDILEYADISKLPEAEVESVMRERMESNYYGTERMFIGKRDETVTLNMADANGNTRLRLYVSASGDPRIEFLDEAGEVVKAIGATVD